MYDGVMADDRTVAGAGPDAVRALQARRNAEFDRNMERFKVSIPVNVWITSSQLILVTGRLGRCR